MSVPTNCLGCLRTPSTWWALDYGWKCVMCGAVWGVSKSEGHKDGTVVVYWDWIYLPSEEDGKDTE